MKWTELNLFFGFLLEVCAFILVGILFSPFILLALLLLPFALLWAIFVGNGIKRYVISEFKREINYIQEVSDGIK